MKHNVLRRLAAFPRSFKCCFGNVQPRKLSLQLQSSFHNLVVILNAVFIATLPYTMVVRLAIIKVNCRLDLIIDSIPYHKLHPSKVFWVNHL